MLVEAKDSWKKPSFSQGLLSCNHSLDTVVHVLYEVFLRAAESAFVGNVVSAVVTFRVFTVDAADLDVELIGDLLETRLILGELGELDEDWAAHGSAEVGRAWGDISEVVVVWELDDSFDVGSSTAESIKDGANVSTHLHADDAELVLLVNPHKEGLGCVVEDTTAAGPVTVESGNFEETVTLPKIC